MDWATVSYWWLRAHPKSPKTIDYKPHQKQRSLSIMSYLYTNFASFFKKIKIKILQNYVNVVHVKLGSLREKQISLIYMIEICKVEFNQPSCWLYSVPNLLVFSQLETLYLGGNHVREVCVREWEELLKCVQRSRESRLDFAGGLRLQAAKLKHTCQACQKLKRRASCSL